MIKMFHPTMPVELFDSVNWNESVPWSCLTLRQRWRHCWRFLSSNVLSYCFLLAMWNHYGTAESQTNVFLPRKLNETFSKTSFLAVLQQFVKHTGGAYPGPRNPCGSDGLFSNLPYKFNLTEQRKCFI